MPGLPRKLPKPNRSFATKPKTPEVWDRFFNTLAQTANVTRSAEFAGVDRVKVYTLRKEDPAFEARFQAAYASGYDKMEEECQRRAFSGYTEPVFYKGSEVGQITKFSDALAQFLLKGNKSDKFRDRVENYEGGSVGPSRYATMTDEELEAELKRRLG